MGTSGIKKWFAVILAAFSISALTPLLIPFSMGSNGNLSTVGYITGGLFWTGLILGCIGYILLYRKERPNLLPKNREEAGRHMPALRFFSNPPAKLADTIMIISVAGTIYCAFNILTPMPVAVIFLLLALVGIYGHFLLNGTLFQYIWDQIGKSGTEEVERKEC